MRAVRRATAGLLACLLAGGLAGCGDSDSESSRAPSPAPTTSPPEASTEPAVDGCPYLTADQVSDALGAPTTETAGTVNACFFDPAGGGEGPSVIVTRVDVQIDPTEYAAQSRALCKGPVTDIELGDEAFACVAALGPQGQLYEGRVLMTVVVDDAVDDETGITAAATLLRMVEIPATAE